MVTKCVRCCEPIPEGGHHVCPQLHDDKSLCPWCNSYVMGEHQVTCPMRLGREQERGWCEKHRGIHGHCHLCDIEALQSDVQTFQIALESIRKATLDCRSDVERQVTLVSIGAQADAALSLVARQRALRSK